MRHYLFVLLLAGCSANTLYHKATPEELAAVDARRAQEERDKNKTASQRLIDQYSPLCEELGFKRDTDPWRQCVVSRIDANQGRTSVCSYIGYTLVCSSR